VDSLYVIGLPRLGWKWIEILGLPISAFGIPDSIARRFPQTRYIQ
jgi:hypothetical protein